MTRGTSSGRLSEATPNRCNGYLLKGKTFEPQRAWVTLTDALMPTRRKTCGRGASSKNGWGLLNKSAYWQERWLG
jgi:hypothetical protein